jgi:transposase-like protein
VSIAAVALVNGLNANMVRKWVIDAWAGLGQAANSDPARRAAATLKSTPNAPPSFLPLALLASSRASEAV